jgi:glycine C-acetyltransferase
VEKNPYQQYEFVKTVILGRRQTFTQRLKTFTSFATEVRQNGEDFYKRTLLTPTDRESVIQGYDGRRRKVLMFGSNNYLGLANHPVIAEKVNAAISEFGVGVGGPPMLNGYTRLHYDLEQRLSAFKGGEDTMLFSSGYAANLGMISGLLQGTDHLIYDKASHASFYDGLKLTDVTSEAFKHNDTTDLESKLVNAPTDKDTFVAVEGVYSMGGDIAPLDDVAALCTRHGAYLLVDDAHGAGVLGQGGKGTADHFGVSDQIAVSLTTFSKIFAVAGGALTASRKIVDYLRHVTRPYIFSASPPPMVAAAVLAGFDVLEQEPERIQQLRKNIRYAAHRLNELGHDVNPQAAIISIRLPRTMNVPEAVRHLEDLGIFVNFVDYPAVPRSQQIFRVSLMASHTKDDIDRLTAALAEVWATHNQESCEPEMHIQTTTCQIQ